MLVGICCCLIRHLPAESCCVSCPPCVKADKLVWCAYLPDHGCVHAHTHHMLSLHVVVPGCGMCRLACYICARTPQVNVVSVFSLCICQVELLLPRIAVLILKNAGAA
jgi:hypothetical protein